MPQYRLTDKDRIATKLLRDEPSGIPASELDNEQQTNLLTVVDRFLERHPRPIALRLQQDVRDQGLEQVYFAWAGDTRPGTPHYFRIHTDRFLMEFVNAVASGNHIHSVLRDFKNDLGGDIITANHPNAFPATLPAGWESDTRKVSSETLDPELHGGETSEPRFEIQRSGLRAHPGRWNERGRARSSRWRGRNNSTRSAATACGSPNTTWPPTSLQVPR